MSHIDELKELFLSNSAEVLPNVKVNTLNMRLISFESVQSIVDKKMAEAYEAGLKTGAQRVEMHTFNL